jgi:hypothetical protein
MILRKQYHRRKGGGGRDGKSSETHICARGIVGRECGNELSGASGAMRNLVMISSTGMPKHRPRSDILVLHCLEVWGVAVAVFARPTRASRILFYR